MLDALEGFTVAVTADRRAREQAELLERRGASVVLAPAIRTLAVSEEDATRRATEALFERTPDFVVANTAIGIRGWVGASGAWGCEERLVAMLQRATVVARGPKAAGAVTALGAAVAWKAPSETLREVVSYLASRSLGGCRIAFQHHGEIAEDLTEALRAAGADVVDVPVYRWTLPVDRNPLERLLTAIVDHRVDAVTFTSPPTVHNVFDVADDMGVGHVRAAFGGPDGVLPVAVGPVTAHALRAHGVGPVAAPQVGRLGSMVRVMTEALRSRCLCLEGGVVVQGSAVAGPGHRAVLTDNEKALVRELASTNGAVLARERLGDDRAVEAAVHRLRRKLGPGAGALVTVSKRGYRLDLTAPAAAG